MGDELVNQTIGDKIFKLRRTLGFTQEQLGKMLGVSSQQIQKYECGINTVSPAKLMQFARLFRCSLDYLCNFEELEGVSAVVDDADFLDRGDFKKTQALIRHFINIESPELRSVAYNVIKGMAELDISALINGRIGPSDKH
jgi:transcriptional regulator with XRE-family HTH domain